MKILHVLDHSVPLFSGYSFRSQSIIQAQRAMGLQPVVLTSPKHGPVKGEMEEIDRVRYYRTAQGKSIVRRVAFAREVDLMRRLACRIKEVAVREKIDVIHSHSPLLNGLPALKVARQLGIPLVYEARAFWEDAAVDLGTFAEGSVRYRISRQLETYLFRNADAVMTICDGMQQELVSRGIKPICAGVMPNGVDATKFQPSDRNRRLVERYSLAGNVVFGFIGSFYHYEGLCFLLDAFAALTQRIPGARLLLVGGGPEEPSVRKLAKKLNGAVVLPGRVPHDKIGEYYSLIDVFVCPRRPLRITELVTPLKPLEAMAMEKAILASNVGGHRELIEDGKTGVLFAADNPEDLVKRASQLANDSDFRRRLGQAARRYVMKERSWTELVQRYLPIYESILKSNSVAQESNRVERVQSRVGSN